MIRKEYQYGIVQGSVRLHLFYQLPDEGIRLHGMGHRPPILIKICPLCRDGAGVNCPGNVFPVPLTDVVHLLGIWPVAGIGQDKVKIVFRRHHVGIAVHHLTVPLVVLHAHVYKAVVLFVAPVGVDQPTAVYFGTGGVEGVCRISGIFEEVRQRIGKAVAAVRLGADAVGGRDQPGIDGILRAEGSGGNKHGGKVILKIDALLLKPVEIGHIVLGEQPCINGFQQEQHHVLPLKGTGHFIVRMHRFLPLGIVRIQLVIGHAVSEGILDAEGHIKAAEQILIAASHIKAAVCVRKVCINSLVRIRLVGGVPCKRTVVRFPHGAVQVPDSRHGGSDHQKPDHGTIKPVSFFGKQHGQQYRQQNPPSHRKQKSLPVVQTGKAEKFCAVSRIGKVGKRKNTAENGVHGAEHQTPDALDGYK